MLRSPLRFALPILTLVGIFLVSCGGGDSAAPVGPDPKDAIASVSLSPTSLSLEVGSSAILSATVLDGHGETVSAAVTWSASPQGIVNVGSNGLVMGMSPGTTTVTARAGGRSGAAQVVVTDTSAPDPPSGLTATVLSETQIQLDWTDNSTNEDEFRIERAEVPPPAALGDGEADGGPQAVFGPLQSVGPDITTFVDGTASPETTYRYRVLGCNENGCSEASADSPDATTPPAPMGTLTISKIVQSASGGPADNPPNPLLNGFGFEVRNAGTTDVAASVETFVNGSVVVLLPPGPYDVVETNPKGMTDVTGLAAGVVVTANSDILVPWVNRQSAIPNGTLTVTKTVLSSTGGTADNPPSPALGGFVFEVREAGTATVAASGGTDASGQLVVSIPPGSYDVVETDPQGLTDVTLLAAGVAVTSSTNTDVGWTNHQPPIPPGTITISKSIESSDGGAPDNPPSPALSGFGFEVRQAGTANVAGSGATDASGQLVVGVPPGSYDVVETDPQGLTDVTTLASGVVVTSGGNADIAWLNRQAPAPPTPLADGVPATGLSGEEDEETFFTFTVPPGGGLGKVLQVRTQGGTGDVDVAIRFGAPPQAPDFDCVSFLDASAVGNLDMCSVTNPSSGVWHILLAGFADYSGVSIEASLEPLTTIADGVAATGLSAGTNEALYFDFTVAGPPPAPPPGASGTSPGLSAGSGAVGSAGSTSSSTFGTVVAGISGDRWRQGMTGGAGLRASVLSGTDQWGAGSGQPLAVGGAGGSAPEVATDAVIGTLTATTTGGTGDADLFGTDAQIQALAIGVPCASGVAGNAEQCVIEDPEEGSWTFMVFGFAAYSGVSFTVDLVTDPVVFERSFLPGGYIGTPYSATPDPATGGGGGFTYSITDGALPPGLSLTPGTGAITGTPSTAGMYFFEMTASNGSGSAAVIFGFTISTAPVGAFNIFGVNVADAIPDAGTMSGINAAFARMEAVIVGDAPNVTLPGSGADGSCSGNYPMLYGQPVDDFVVFINIAPIDGPSGTLGFAGGCGFIRLAAPLGITGQLTLDSDDMALQSPTAKFDIMWHEIAHTLGFSESYWVAMGLMTGANGPDPRYVGAGAVAEFTALGGAAPDIPIEADFGEGSRDSHWDEGFFNTELMSPQKDGTNQISRMSIAALGDLGWSISFATADPYSIPGCSPGCIPPPGAPFFERGGLVDHVLDEPLYVRNADGTVSVVWPGGG